MDTIITPDYEIVKRRKLSAKLVANYVHEHPKATINDITDALGTTYNNVKHLLSNAKKKGLLTQGVDGQWRKPGSNERNDMYIEELEQKVQTQLREIEDLKGQLKKAKQEIATLKFNQAKAQDTQVAKPASKVITPPVIKAEPISRLVDKVIEAPVSDDDKLRIKSITDYLDRGFIKNALPIANAIDNPKIRQQQIDRIQTWGK